MPTPTNAPEYPEATEKVAREMGVNASEWAQIQQVLGRVPTYTEIGMYAVMWSEHCGYKYSRPVLKAFSEYKKAQESGALENAGGVPLGDTGWSVVFKMESHNHPSAVEPFQGAATGVGGILRDIFTMGARPIACLDSLRFGPITGEGKDVGRTRYLFDGVVSGIAHYGNCLSGSSAFYWRKDGGVAVSDTIGNFVKAQLSSSKQRDAFVQPGIETLSFDLETGSVCWKPVTRVFLRNHPQYVRIQTSDQTVLVMTPDHPALILHEGQIVEKEAGELVMGDIIPYLPNIEQHLDSAEHLNIPKQEAPIRFSTIKHACTQKSPFDEYYDVEVADTHTFVTNGGIVTHNCVGVPTVAGEIYFHPCYNGNPLVNAMAIGVVRSDSIASAQAKGVGNPVLYVGSATGRDGIHGATFASVELTEESEEKRSNVQVGDPFLEKLLIEATLEALQTGHIVGIQDMGAAGLTCGTCEMSAKGALGMEIDVQKVPHRETGMSAYEIMLSESQERMLAVVQKGKEAEVAAVFEKWGLNAAYIGHTTDDGRVKVWDGDRLEADVPAKSLADDCPVYSLDAAEPAYIKTVQSADFSHLAEPESYGDALLALLSHPSIASKRWVWEQYDHMVQTQTEVLPGQGDAAVLAVREAGGRRIAATTDCNPRFVYLDPYKGAQLAIAEAARNLSCVGAVPAATTDCLNFPSPEKPEGFWQFTQAVNGMAAACDFFQTPVVSGNVSFYNETPEGAIYPTPTVGMVGVFPEGVEPVGLAFQNNLDLIYVLRPQGWEAEQGIGGSEYLHVVHGRDEGTPPRLDLEKEAAVQRVVRAAIAQKLISSAHDCAEGGLLVALAESCLAGNIGAEIRFSVTDFADQPWSAICFGEAASRIVVTVKEATPQHEALLDLAEREGIEAVFIGQVKDNGRFDAAGLLDLPLDALKDAYEGAIPRAMSKK
jgi:phosphoribosylformylglycinamidine synthase subunit PurL